MSEAVIDETLIGASSQTRKLIVPCRGALTQMPGRANELDQRQSCDRSALSAGR